jgi:hypothetical protein
MQEEEDDDFDEGEEDLGEPMDDGYDDEEGDDGYGDDDNMIEEDGEDFGDEENGGKMGMSEDIPVTRKTKKDYETDDAASWLAANKRKIKKHVEMESNDPVELRDIDNVELPQRTFKQAISSHQRELVETENELYGLIERIGMMMEFNDYCGREVFKGINHHLDPTQLTLQDAKKIVAYAEARAKAHTKVNNELAGTLIVREGLVWFGGIVEDWAKDFDYDTEGYKDNLSEVIDEDPRVCLRLYSNWVLPYEKKLTGGSSVISGELGSLFMMFKKSLDITDKRNRERKGKLTSREAKIQKERDNIHQSASASLPPRPVPSRPDPRPYDTPVDAGFVSSSGMNGNVNSSIALATAKNDRDAVQKYQKLMLSADTGGPPKIHGIN